MAGWMAHDAGRDASARRHFGRSLDLAAVGGDAQLSAHSLASMSHLAHHIKAPDDAIWLARRGQKVLAKAPSNPQLTARLLALEARGFAAMEQPGECGRTLTQAEKALGKNPIDDPSPWVSRFDEASLANEAARCWQSPRTVETSDDDLFGF